MGSHRLPVWHVVLGLALLAIATSFAVVQTPRPLNPPRRGPDPSQQRPTRVEPPQGPGDACVELPPTPRTEPATGPVPEAPQPSPAEIVRSPRDWGESQEEFQRLYWGDETRLVLAIEDLLRTLSEAEFDEGLAELVALPATVHAPCRFADSSLLRLASLLEAQSSPTRRRFLAGILCAATLGEARATCDEGAREGLVAVLRRELDRERDPLVETQIRVLLSALAPGGQEVAELVAVIGESLSTTRPQERRASEEPTPDPREDTLSFLSQQARAGVQVCLEVLCGLVRHPDESLSEMAWIACTDAFFEEGTGPATRERLLGAIDSWSPRERAEAEDLVRRTAREAAWFLSDRDIDANHSSVRSFLFGKSPFLRSAALCFSGNHPDLLRPEEWEMVRRAAGPGEPPWLAALAQEALEAKARWEARLEGSEDPFAPSGGAAYPVPR